MRIRVFKNLSKTGKPYFTFTTKDKVFQDCKWVSGLSHLTWYVRFAKCTEPIFNKQYSGNREYECADLDVNDCILGNTTEYNGKINPSIVITSYNEVKPAKENTQEKFDKFVEDNGFNSNETLDITDDNLPFY